MKLLIPLFFTLLQSFSSNGQIIGKKWRIESCFAKAGNNTVQLFHKDSLTVLWPNLYFFEVEFFSDNTFKTLDVNQQIGIGTWNFISPSSIKIDSDTLAFEQLAVNEFIYTAITKTYGSNNELYTSTLVTKMTLITQCTNNVSLKSGSWDDPSIWYCGYVPTLANHVIISPSHRVVINPQKQSLCKSLFIQREAILENQSRLLIANP